MTVEIISSQPTVKANPQSRAVAGNPLITALGYLASLKLTVGLLIVAVLVTFIGTLEQTRADINTVKSKYFLENRVFVNVPLNVLMVPSWFPEYQNIRGSFYVPSGMTILMLMIVNMTAAHVIRFRLQASGWRLLWGLLVGALAAVFTWAIIFNTPNPGSAPGEPPIPWFQMWMMLLIVILGVGCGAAFGFATLPKERKYERMFMAITAVLAGGALLLTMLLPNKGFVGESAMRILWQLSQSTAAACIGLVASMLLFRRKGGIVLLHLGVVGLMANELYVNYTNVEQRITLQEGETSNRAVDIRAAELAIVDLSDPQVDNITSIPAARLTTGSTIQTEELPFDVKVLEFYENSEIDVVKNRAENRATQGSGMTVEVTAKPPASGIDSNARSFPSAYVQLLEKQSGKSLGTYLVSQYFEIPELTRVFSVPGKDVVEYQGKKFLLDLRFKTEYKPYSILLQDVKAEYYLGTQTPKYFSSDIVFQDPQSDLNFEKRIWMNNPMRYAGETFYQTNYETDRLGREISTLQIVKNRGWMIPYVCCMFTVVGLFVQFGTSLLAFLEKRDKVPRASSLKSGLPLPSKASGLATPHPDFGSQSKSSWNWLPAAILAGLCGVYVASQAATAYRGTVKKDELRLDLLGQLPVTKNGRVQPLDSVARHAALQMSKRELVNNQLELRQPAIRWLADTMFGAEGYDQYRLFRIEDSEVLDALGLPFPMPTKDRHQKSNLKYTLEELLKARSKFLELLQGDPEKYTPFQQRLDRVAVLVTQATSLELTLGYPTDAKLSLFERLEMAERNASNTSIPLMVPTHNPERPWISFPAMEDQKWLIGLGEQYNAKTTVELAKFITKNELLPFQREELIKARVIEKIVSNDELVAMLSKEYGQVDKEELKRLLKSRWNQIPAERTESLRQIEGPFVDAIVAEQTPRLERLMEEQLAKINGKSGVLEASYLPVAEDLQQLRKAYLDGDAPTFNTTLEKYLAAMKASPPTGMRLSALSTEYWYNRFAPFYLAMIIYAAVAVLSMISWIGFSDPLNRAAGWLLWLGLSVHLIGMVARVVISGRPPVTNLYSSFLFTAVIAVLGMGILERFTRMRINYFLGGWKGFLALLVAWNMTLSDGDTFSVLVAVLDTQFWLATHVVTITIGYGATMMAGFFGLMYVVKGLFTSSLVKQSRRSLADVIYGTVCFGLVTSFFGTVLGGLWGDDSWGRFWGWDPKENGALMIVLWNAVILHARWGGIVRERGMALLAILGNVITLWSWKGVNVLGVGLHAYAGTEDKALIYMILFGGVCLLTAAIGLIPTKYWASYAADSPSAAS